MVDPKKTSGVSEQPKSKPAVSSGLGVGVSSEDDVADGGEPRRSPAPLLERIRQDKNDLEAKIAKLKSYIKTSSDMMNKLKDVPDMKERYEHLTATRADLVQNAVNLQQLLVKLQQSENRASSLAGRERALAAETAARHQSDLAELARELPPEVIAELSAEDKANYEKKRELLKRINQSQEKLRAMEVEQQRLRLMKENVEWKLAEARTSRLGLQEKAHELLHDMPGVHPAADATNWESTAAPDRSALELLDARVSALQQLPMQQLDAEAAQQLQQRLAALKQKRLQLNSMAEQLQLLQSQAEREPRPDAPPPPKQGDVAPATSPSQEQQQQDLSQDALLQDHVAAMSGQRQRLQELERSVAAIKQTLSQPESTLTEEQEQQARQEQERSQMALQEQEENLRRRAEQVEESRQQLDRLKRLMAAVEEAHATGHRLSDAVPHQLTELLASVHQLESQPEGGQQTGEALQQVLQPDTQSQSQASEYVAVLRRLQESVDSLGVLQHPDQ